MKQYFLLPLTLLALTFKAQTITVVDKISREPLAGAFVTANGQNPAFCNKKGSADITLILKERDSIAVGFSNYKTRKLTVNELQKTNFTVELEETNISLSEVIVSAYRGEESKIETPNRVEKLNMKEASFQNPQTTADLLATSGYAFIQKSQLGGGSPMLRGMATNRVLLVVDGVRMNTAIFRSGNLQNVISLDAHALENVEILFGPGSVMYGSDAIGGVMSFMTLQPKLTDTLNKSYITGNALMRTSTANSENTRHIDINCGFKKWAFITSFSRSEYGDLRSGTVGGVNSFYRPQYVQTIANNDYMVANRDSALQIGSKYSQNNLMQKVSFKPGKWWLLDYGFHYSETSPYNRYDRLYVIRTSGPNKNKLRWAEWYYGPQKWNMNRLGITHSRANKLYNRLNLIVAVQNNEESRYDREFMAKELQMQKETVRAVSANIDLEKKLSNKISLLYGAEFVHNKVGSFASLTNVITQEVNSSVTRYPNGSLWTSYGAYVSFKYKPNKKFIISNGLRYSAFNIKAVFDTTFFPFPFRGTTMNSQTLNGSLGAVYTPVKSWQLYVNLANGFRAPNIDDMGKVFESTPGFLVVPNTRLKPEQAYNGEIGTVKTFGDYVKFDFASYYTNLVNAMERKDYLFNGSNTIVLMGDTSKIQAVQNIARAWVYGIQTGIEINYKGFGFRSNLSYQNGKEQSSDASAIYPLRHAAPLFGNTHVTYQRKKLKLDFFAIYNGKMDYEDMALTERQNPSYARDYSVDPAGRTYLQSWYTLNFKAAFYLNQYVVLMTGIENIADRLYRPYSSGINAPGRNFIFSLKSRF